MWRNEWAILDDLLHFDFCIIIFIISASYKTGLTNICMWIMLLEPNPIMQNAILQPHISINWWYKSSNHQLSGQSICHHVILSSNVATIHHRRQPFPCPISRVHTWHPFHCALNLSLYLYLMPGHCALYYWRLYYIKDALFLHIAITSNITDAQSDIFHVYISTQTSTFPTPLNVVF